MLAVFVGAAAVVAIVLGRIRDAAEDVQSTVGTLGADLERAMSALRTIKVSRAENREAERLIAAAADSYRAAVRAARLTAAATPAVQAAASAAFLVVLVVGGARVAAGQLGLGDLVTLLLFATYLVVPLSNVLEGLTALKTAQGALQRVRGCARRAHRTGDGGGIRTHIDRRARDDTGAFSRPRCGSRM